MKKSLVLYFFLISLYLNAQAYKNYSIEQGLPGNRIYKILEDKEGFIWIATDKGLSKFDGAVFKNFTISNGLPSNDIWNIILTKDHKLWCFTRSNKMGYILNDSIYKYSTANNELLYPNNISTDRQKIVFKSYGTNYILKNGQWIKLINDSKYSGKKIPHKILHPKVDYLLNVSSVDHQHFYSKFHLKDKNHNDLLVFDFKTKKGDKAIYEGQVNDSLIVFKIPRSLRIINLNTLKIYDLKQSDLLKLNNYIRVIATDHNIQISGPNFWATLGHNYQLQDITYFPKDLSLTTVFKDKGGNYWGTTNARGIYFFSRKGLHSKRYLYNLPVQLLKKQDHNLFAAVLHQGIYKYNKKLDVFQPFFKTNDYFYNFYYKDDNNFVILANTTSFIKQNGRIIKKDRIGKNILPYKNGYIVSNIGKVIYYSKNFKPLKTFNLEGINTICPYNNHFVAGTPIGIYHITDTKITKIQIPGKSQLPVLSLKSIDNSLVIGTDGFGAYFWQNGQKMIFLKETSGLIVHDIFIDKNNILFATDRGVLKFEYNSEEKTLKFNQILRKHDGLISDHVDHVVIMNNHIYSSNYSGIASVSNTNFYDLPLPKIYFESVKYGSKPIKPNSRFRFVENNGVFINFGLIDFSGQEHTHYYYQLLPNLKTWTEINTKNVSFNNLPPAQYQFKVKAVNSYLQNNIKEFSFSILPLWWQTTWAKALFVFIFLASIFFIGLYTRRKELKKQRDKLMAQKQMAEFELHALRSQMNPHFVFNSLNAIQYYINDENYDKSETYLVKFSRLIRMIFEFSRKKTISLRQEIDLLTSYLNLEKMRFGDRFNFCFNIDPKLNIDHIEIPTLLLQPIVENAVNHGIFHKKSKGTICLDFKYIDPQTFEVTIKDDGVGIEKSKQINLQSLKKHRSRSTEILKDRIKLLNLSEKWQITYNLQDNTNNNQTTYNTIVKLKIKKL
ncbi:MAG TPA: hypothetical protein ENK67_07855 [Flavobacteriia bacterium]|nr:hypothetical protein [Flavobacteriia bacterium]